MYDNALVPGQGRGRALIVEDSKSDRLLVKSMLERLGCACDVAADGEEGVAAAVSGDYDFIVMDLEMPQMDGLAATRWIHRTLGPSSPFIVALSGHRSDSDRRKAADAGIDYFLPKPVRLSALAKLLAD